jgi:hypothetical protein
MYQNNNRVVDYMAASQAIAVLALIEFGIVCYFLSFERIHEKMFKQQFKTSKIPDLIKQHPDKAVILFREARLKYDELISQSEKASSEESQANYLGSRNKRPTFVEMFSPTSRSNRKVANLNNNNNNNNNMKQQPMTESAQETMKRLEDGRSSGMHVTNVGSYDSVNAAVEASIDSAMSTFDIANRSHSPVSPSPIAHNQKTTAFDSVKVFSGPSPKTSVAPKSSTNTSQAFAQAHDFKLLNLNLTIPEVTVIAHVREAFKTFDTDHNGVLRVFELKRVCIIPFTCTVTHSPPASNIYIQLITMIQ